MKRILKIVPIFCTLLLLGLGAYMPRLASLTLDHQLEKESTQMENTPFSMTFTKEDDFFETLELFHSAHSQVNLSEGYHMKAEAVEEAAVKIITELSASGRVYMPPEVTPVLITSKDNPSLSGVFWRCVWNESTDTDEILWLDDRSGQMIAFTGKVGTSTLYVTSALFHENALKIAEFCRLHYPVDDVKLAVETDDEKNSTYTVSFVRNRDGLEETYTVSMRLRGEWLYFNS